MLFQIIFVPWSKKWSFRKAIIGGASNISLQFRLVFGIYQCFLIVSLKFASVTLYVTDNGIRNFFIDSAIVDKIFGTKWKNPVKLDRKKTFDVYFCGFFFFFFFFDCYCQSLISGMFPRKFETFFIFPNFLRS